MSRRIGATRLWIRRTDDDRFQLSCLFRSKHTGADDKTDAEGNLQGKRCAPAFCDVDDELGMFPIFELRAGHVKWTSMYFSQLDVARADAKRSPFVTHGRGTVATAAALEKHQFPMFSP